MIRLLYRLIVEGTSCRSVHTRTQRLPTVRDDYEKPSINKSKVFTPHSAWFTERHSPYREFLHRFRSTFFFHTPEDVLNQFPFGPHLALAILLVQSPCIQIVFLRDRGQCHDQDFQNGSDKI